jgi:hypothetical protein
MYDLSIYCPADTRHPMTNAKGCLPLTGMLWTCHVGTRRTLFDRTLFHILNNRFVLQKSDMCVCARENVRACTTNTFIMAYFLKYYSACLVLCKYFLQSCCNL